MLQEQHSGTRNDFQNEVAAGWQSLGVGSTPLKDTCLTHHVVRLVRFTLEEERIENHFALALERNVQVGATDTLTYRKCFARASYCCTAQRTAMCEQLPASRIVTSMKARLIVYDTLEGRPLISSDGSNNVAEEITSSSLGRYVTPTEA